MPPRSYDPGYGACGE